MEAGTLLLLVILGLLALIFLQRREGFFVSYAVKTPGMFLSPSEFVRKMTGKNCY